MVLGSPRCAAAALCMVTAFPLRNVCAKKAPIPGPKLYGDLCAEGATAVAPLWIGRVVFGAGVGHVGLADPLSFLACCRVGRAGRDGVDSFSVQVMALLNALYNVLSFRVLCDVSAVTHAQLRLGKRVFSLATSLFVLHDMILTPQTCAALATTVLALAAYSVLKAVTRRSAPSSAGATENEPHDRPRSAAVATWVLLALLVTTRVTPRVSVMPDLSSPDATPCAAPPPHAHRRRHRHFIRRSAGSRL